MSLLYRTRWIAITTVAVALMAGAAAASKLWHTPVGDVWLMSSRHPADDSVPTSAAVASNGAPITPLADPAIRLGSRRSSAGEPAIAPLIEGSVPNAVTGTAGLRTSAAVNRTSGGTSSPGVRRFASGMHASGSSASLAGLWHAMNPLGTRRSAAADAPKTAAVKPVDTATPPSKPAPKPAPAPAPKRPSPPAPPAAPASPAGAVVTEPIAEPGVQVPTSDPIPDPPAAPPPTGGFDEHTTPIDDLGDGSGGSQPGGPLGAGPGFTDPPAGGGNGFSPTPEPGTMALLGTGLLGVLGVVRRRRS